MKRVLKIILIVVFAVIVIWTAFHQIMSKIDSEALKKDQTFVSVNDSKMHYVKSGNGSETIILLTGFGTTFPSLDFQPMMTLLAEQYTVYSIDPFGYGLSDIVDTERSIENITMELHEAIDAFDIEGSYYLMGHSISGLYSIKYADLYPEEVKGLIGIDSSIPGQESMSAVNSTLGYKLMNFLGVYRFILLIAPDAFIPEELNYSDMENKTTLKIMSYNTYNKNILSEMDQMQRSLEAASIVTLKPELPVLILLAEDSANSEGNWVELHDDFMSNQENYHRVIVKGSHYLHRMSAEEILKETNEFINNFSGN